MVMKDIKTSFIIDVATELFLDNSISEITIKDIATKAGIGEATVYRYFTKKQNIVLQSVMKLQEFVSSKYFDLSKGHTGYEKLAIFYNSYLEIFKDNMKFYKFIREFDAFMMLEENAQLDEYEMEVNKYKDIFLEAYELGLNDGTVRKQKDVELFYYSTAHALLELCKKLAGNKEILNQDKLIEKASEVETLVNVVLFSLKNL